MRAEGAASGDMAAAEAEATGFRSKGLTGEALRNAAEQAAQAAKGLVTLTLTLTLMPTQP